MSSDTNENSTFLIVLGFSQKLRSIELTSLTAELEDCIFVEPPVVRTSERTPDLIDEVRSEVLLGRRMTNGEIGCAKGHKQVIVAAHNGFMARPNACWVLVAEDDADLTFDLYQQAGTDLASLDNRVPNFVNFYTDSLSVTRVSKLNITATSKFKARRKWQNGTVCYAMNREAIRELLPFAYMPVDNVADWPVYYARLKLLVSTNILVTEVPGQSTIGMRSSLGVLPRLFMHLRQLRHLRTLSQLYGLPSRTVVQHLIYTPLLRDVQGRISSLAKLLRVF
jgi:GR25 family glycosyltransferase involved in LPS biosynthesis